MRLRSPKLALARRRFRAEVPPAPFVVGVARSGTTLLRLMLDAHPQLAIPPETHFVPRVVNVCERLVAEGASTAEIRGQALAAMTTHPRWEDFGLSEDEVRELMERHDPLDPGDAIRSFYEAYAAGEGKPRWGDKSPPYTWKSLRIQRALPEAHFIHIIRDGRDVALSLSEVSWGPGDVTAGGREVGQRAAAGAQAGQGSARAEPTWSFATRTSWPIPSRCCGRSPASSTCRGTRRCSTTTARRRSE